MSEKGVHLSLKNLPQYFPNLDIGDVEDLLEPDLDRVRKKLEIQELQENDDSDDECLRSKQDPQIYSRLRKAMQGFDCVDLMQEIYNDAVWTRNDAGFKEYDSWEFLAEIVDKEKYMGFIYALVHLWELDPASEINRKLSFNAARMYLFLLTTPGAKSCEIFDEDLVQRSIAIFNILSMTKTGGMTRKIGTHKQTQILLQLASLLEDLSTIFKIVSFEEFKDLKKSLIKHLKNIILHNHTHGYENICKSIKS